MSTELYLPQLPKHVVSERGSNGNVKMKVQAAKSQPDAMPSGETTTYRVSYWCVCAGKRAFDLACVVPALFIISPLLGMVALAVRISSPGPIIFRQQRIGKYRTLFTIYKFRTMVYDADSTGSNVTVTGDPRITRIGHFLRKWKLDELPQLFNVLRGDMSLVGPRPKLPQHELTSMPCRPGVTGAATLLFRQEHHILREIAPDQIAEFYSQFIAPAKVEFDATYMRSATLFSDLKILWSTIFGNGQHVTRENLIVLDFDSQADNVAARSN